MAQVCALPLSQLVLVIYGQRTESLVRKLHLVKHTFGAPMLLFLCIILLHRTFLGTFNLRKIVSIASRLYLSIVLCFVSLLRQVLKSFLISPHKGQNVCSVSDKTSEHIYIKEQQQLTVPLCEKNRAVAECCMGNPTYILNQNY